MNLRFLFRSSTVGMLRTIQLQRRLRTRGGLNHTLHSRQVNRREMHTIVLQNVASCAVGSYP